MIAVNDSDEKMSNEASESLIKESVEYKSLFTFIFEKAT